MTTKDDAEMVGLAALLLAEAVEKWSANQVHLAHGYVVAHGESMPPTDAELRMRQLLDERGVLPPPLTADHAMDALAQMHAQAEEEAAKELDGDDPEPFA